jgi:streptogramin lyase
VNEGVWRQDNATLTYYDPSDGTTILDYFTVCNPGLRLGDVANSVAVWNGRAYIAVSTSRTIEVIDPATGRSLGRVRTPEGNEPRAVAIVDSATAYAACFSDSVVRFNPMTMAVTGIVAVGPAPEAVVYAAGHVLVANSGYGYYRRFEPKAGTLSVLNPVTGADERQVPIGPNPRQIRYDSARGRLYVLYGLADSAGGVVELDAATLLELRRWRIDAAVDIVVGAREGVGYVIGKQGVMAIDFASAGAEPRVFIPAEAWPRRTFYSLGLAPGGALYLGTYTYFTMPGEVLVFDGAGALASRFTAGLGPGDFALY